MNKINSFYLCNCSNKTLQNEANVQIVKLIIAERILICEDCYKLFEKLFQTYLKIFNRNPFKKQRGCKSFAILTVTVKRSMFILYAIANIILL